MQRISLLAPVVLFVLVVSGCKSSAPILESVSSLGDIQAIQFNLAKTGAPSVEQYRTVRQDFVMSMNDVVAEQRRQSQSSARKLKTRITGTGALVALAGTVASLLVDNRETQAAIAQAGGGLAAATGIVGLLPIGSEAESAGEVSTYLEAELPVFESRWPEDIDDALTIHEWASFVRDVEHLTTAAESYAQQ